MLPLLLFGFVCVCGVTASQAWVEYADVPESSHGDLVFHVDIVTFYGGDGENVEEIYCIVANDQVVFLEEDGTYRGSLRFRTRILDGDGKAVGESENIIEVSAATLDDTVNRSVVQVLQSEVRVPPGRYTAEVTLEDLNKVQKTLVSFFLKRYMKGETTVEIESPEFEERRLGISDIEFARSLRRTSEGAFQKSGFEVIPNAQRRYGLLLTELPVFFEVYDFREDTGGDSLVAAYSILNKTGDEIFTSENTIAMQGRTFGSTALFDILSLTAGSYLLSLSISDRDGNALARSERRFDVVWSPLSWGRYESEMIEDMEFVLTEDEMKDFKVLSTGEREQFMREFWLRIDPTPGTAENEALEEHYRRVRFADRSYGGSTQRGALSDRGRIYVKYGPPDDIQSHYSDFEFVQGTRHMEGGESPVPTDPFSRVGLKTGSGGSSSWDRAGSDAETHSDQRGGSMVHGKGYEIWSYDGAGNPVRRLSKRTATSARMQFILVDERGFGDYRLIYSTEKHEY
ncbi:MAG: GWxTD domain-containing protein [Candidatus Eisenbacteria bacterium]